jgi:GR25 family glycosyltransferase involved in LPS biosynthesis
LRKKKSIFVITIKNSKRESYIRKRLNDLKLKYKLYYAIDGNDNKNYSFLDSKYNKSVSENIMGNKMNYPEISIAYSHLSIYKHIVENNIPRSIIMEDDCFPSKNIIKWINCSDDQLNNFDLINFYSVSGFLYKKPYFITNNGFKIYKAYTHIPNATCYQINLKACKYIVKKSCNKIFTVADWPILFSKKELDLYSVVPLLSGVHFDHLSTATNKSLWKNKNYVEAIKKKIPLYRLLSAFYYIFHIPILLGRKVWGGPKASLKLRYSYYKEFYLNKKICYIKNFFLEEFIDLDKYEFNKYFYSKDLHSNLKKLVNKNNV